MSILNPSPRLLQAHTDLFHATKHEDECWQALAAAKVAKERATKLYYDAVRDEPADEPIMDE